MCSSSKPKQQQRPRNHGSKRTQSNSKRYQHDGGLFVAGGGKKESEHVAAPSCHGQQIPGRVTDQIPTHGGGAHGMQVESLEAVCRKNDGLQQPLTPGTLNYMAP